MLVLTRREGEQIQIGDGITITVVRITPHAIRIGIDAPAEMLVIRRELLVGPERGSATEPEGPRPPHQAG